jgi:hypothetical protein
VSGTEAQLAAEVVVAQALVEGLAVVFQAGEIELPATAGASQGSDGEVEAAAGVEHEAFHRIGAAEGFAGADPTAQDLLRELETAIVERRRIELERYASVGSFPGSPLGSVRVWPLQLHLPANQSHHRPVSRV